MVGNLPLTYPSVSFAKAAVYSNIQYRPGALICVPEEHPKSYYDILYEIIYGKNIKTEKPEKYEKYEKYISNILTIEKI